MMKRNNKWIALLTAALMALSFAGCLVPEAKTPEANASASATDAAPAAPVDTASYDREAIAVELGDIKITAGEIEDSYNYYVSMLQSYYGVEITDDASIKEYRDMAINDLIHYYMPQWKAAELGVKLTAEEEAEIKADVNAQIDELRTGLICEYAHEYGGAEEVYDDVSKLTAEELDGAMTEINLELSQYFREGYTLEDYLAEQQKSLIADMRTSAISDKLREASMGDYSVSDEAVETWYADTLEAQKTAYDADPSAYRDAVEDYASGNSTVPVLYAPEGMLRVQIIEIAPEAERDIKIDTNRSRMAELEAEYGKLALNNGEAERMAEILQEYALLKTENDALEEAFIGEARAKINKAYEALEEETPFEEVMKQYNAEGAAAETLLCADGDERYGELCDFAAELLEGTYSEPILIDDVYYIVKLIGKQPAGVIDRNEIADAIRAAAAADSEDAEWNALYEEWETEAETAAIRHEDAYAAIGYLA